MERKVEVMRTKKKKNKQKQKNGRERKYGLWQNEKERVGKTCENEVEARRRTDRSRNRFEKDRRGRKRRMDENGSRGRSISRYA